MVDSGRVKIEGSVEDLQKLFGFEQRTDLARLEEKQRLTEAIASVYATKAGMYPAITGVDALPILLGQASIAPQYQQLPPAGYTNQPMLPAAPYPQQELAQPITYPPQQPAPMTRFQDAITAISQSIVDPFIVEEPLPSFPEQAPTTFIQEKKGSRYSVVTIGLAIAALMAGAVAAKNMTPEARANFQKLNPINLIHKDTSPAPAPSPEQPVEVPVTQPLP